MDEWQVAPGRVLALAQGDITRIPADAIVNAANSHLGGGGGVDGAIHSAGGPAIMADLERRYGPPGVRSCPTGSAVVSAAGTLPASWVIHAVGPVWQGGRSGEAELLASAYRSSLQVAVEIGARTVAFPSISTGIFGYPLELAAPVAVAAAREAWAAHTDAIDVVAFYLYSEREFDEFMHAGESVG